MNEIKVSVIVPVRNKIYSVHSVNMIKSILKNADEENWEMIIVFDNYILPEGLDFIKSRSGQPDELLYRELIETFKANPSVRVLRSSDSKYKFDNSVKEFRIAAAINWGVQNAVGKYIFFTCDDLYHTPSWLKKIHKLSEQFDMSKTIINPVNVESFEVCDQDTDVKEKMWLQSYDDISGRRCFFSKIPRNVGISDLDLIKYWNLTKIDTFVEEKNCDGHLGNLAPLFMLKDLWISMGGRQFSDVNYESGTEFHDRLKNMGITKIIPRNVYIFNLDIPNKFINI